MPIKKKCFDLRYSKVISLFYLQVCPYKPPPSGTERHHPLAGHGHLELRLAQGAVPQVHSTLQSNTGQDRTGQDSKYSSDHKRWIIVFVTINNYIITTITKYIIIFSDSAILEYQHEDCWFNRYSTKEFRNLATVFRYIYDIFKDLSTYITIDLLSICKIWYILSISSRKIG